MHLSGAFVQALTAKNQPLPMDIYTLINVCHAIRIRFSE